MHLLNVINPPTGAEVPFPGVDNSLSRGQLTIKHTKYYQWVAFTLFFQVSIPEFSRFYFSINKMCDFNLNSIMLPTEIG